MNTRLYLCPLCYQAGFSKSGLKAHACRGVFGNRWSRKLTPHELAAAKSYRATTKRKERAA